MPRTPKDKTTQSKPQSQSQLQPESQPEDWSYEQTLSQIESITHQLETGDLPLAEVFEQFSEAVNALQQCDRFLQAKQAQASLLIETLVDSEDS
ncbi:MAG: exodeoxyribonuclease VII small subunit [Cyanobacteria bacterium J06598_1]